MVREVVWVPVSLFRAFLLSLVAIHFVPLTLTPQLPLCTDPRDSESEAYLSDRQGRSVTPIIRPLSEVAISQSEPPVAAPVYRGVGRPPLGGVSKDERVAAAELEKLKHRQRDVGLSLVKGGVRFANEKRRMGFVDDEQFEEVVSSDGEGVGR